MESFISAGSGNKHWRSHTINVSITIKLNIEFIYSSKEDAIQFEKYRNDPINVLESEDSIFDFLNTNMPIKSKKWWDFYYRNCGVVHDLQNKIIQQEIPNTHISINDIEVGDHITGSPDLCIKIQKIYVPSPRTIKCVGSGCPYYNYYGVCRNCEDDPNVQPIPEEVQRHRDALKQFKKDVKFCGNFTYLTIDKETEIEGITDSLGTVKVIIRPYTG